MERKEFIEVYNRCHEKSKLFYSWELTEDYDEDLDLYIDDHGCLYIKDIKTPYSCKDVKRIKYRYFDDEYGAEESYVVIWFYNGDRLQLGESNFKDYSCLNVKLEDGMTSYSDKALFEYLAKIE